MRSEQQLKEDAKTGEGVLTVTQAEWTWLLNHGHIEFNEDRSIGYFLGRQVRPTK